MTSRNLRRANAHREQERETDAELSSVGFQTALLGTGEAWIGPILFGRAFVHPPQFSYSAVDGTAGVGSDLVKPLSWPTGSMQSSTDAMDWDGWVTDPQYDMQMRWGDPYIPDLDDHVQWKGYQKIWATLNPAIGWQDDTAGYSDSEPGFVNCWLQAIGSGARWGIVDAYPYSDDRRGGRYSAQYVFGSETESRRLYPVRPRGFSLPTSEIGASYDNDAYERAIFSCTYDGASPDQYPMGPWLAIGTNPPCSPFTFSTAINVSAACEVEILCRHWDQSTEWHIGAGASIFHAELHEEIQTVALSAGQNLVELEFPVPSNLYPNYPSTDASYYGGDIYVTFGMRILGGTPGLRVNAQRTLIWPNFNDYSGMPMVTIGVAEWITSVDGAYVGANLWAKTRDLTVGTTQAVVETNPPPPCGFYRRVGDLYVPPANNPNNDYLYEILDGHTNPGYARYIVFGIGEFAGFVINDNRFWVPTIIQARTGTWQAEGDKLVLGAVNSEWGPLTNATSLFYAGQLACHTVNVTYFGVTDAVYPPYSAVLIAGDLLRFGFDYSWTRTNNTTNVESGNSGWTVQAWTVGKNALPPPEYTFNISGTKQADVTSQVAYSLSPGQSQTYTGHVELEMMATEDRVAFVYAFTAGSGFSDIVGGEISNMFLEVQGT